MRILVCGGRDYADSVRVWVALDELRRRRPLELIMHGDAPGADRAAGAWARARGVRELKFPANWRLFGKIAGPVRNQHMLWEGRPGAVVAFPGGAGTADMVRRAAAAGLPIWRPYGQDLAAKYPRPAATGTPTMGNVRHTAATPRSSRPMEM